MKLAVLSIALMGLNAPYGAFFSFPTAFLRGRAAGGGMALCNTFGSLGGFFGPSLLGLLRQGSGDFASGMQAVGTGYLLSALIVFALGFALARRPKVAAPAASEG